MLSNSNFDVAGEKWDAAKAEAKDILIQHAKKQKTIFYSELVTHIRSIHIEAHDRRLFQLLGEISTEEHRFGRGMLTALVVHKSDGQPGNGFFELAESLDRTVEDKDKFWIEELQRVYNYWREL